MAQASSHTTTDNLAGFVSIIASYEHRVGHACRLVAVHILQPFLTNLLPPHPVILDNACGTGAPGQNNSSKRSLRLAFTPRTRCREEESRARRPSDGASR